MSVERTSFGLCCSSRVRRKQNCLPTTHGAVKITRRGVKTSSRIAIILFHSTLMSYLSGSQSFMVCGPPSKDSQHLWPLAHQQKYSALFWDVQYHGRVI